MSEPEAQERAGFAAALGRTIQVLRTDQGIDRKDLAARADISYSYLSAIENGDKPPSSQVIRRIAEALGMRSHHLMRAAEERVDAEGPVLTMEQPAPRYDAVTRSTVAAYSPAPPSRRRSWFHAEEVAAPDKPRSREEWRRGARDALSEFEELLPVLGEDDRERVLDLARRLAVSDTNS